MAAEWEKLRQKVEGLQAEIARFEVDFLDRDGFKEFCDNFMLETEGYLDICITGYFSETIRKSLENTIERRHKVRLVCPELSESVRDKKNLEALKKLASVGAEIRVNNRLHARFLVAYNRPFGGLLVIGSFDFNTECMGRERYDAGIKTKHPDLVNSAIALFEQIWTEPESQTLEEFIKKRNEK
jgi:hypothetical protein